MPHLPEQEDRMIPELGTLGTRFAAFLWMTDFARIVGAPNASHWRIEGLIKTKTSPETDAEWRREAMASYNELLQLLAGLGIRHWDHPQIDFGGEVYDQPDGTQKLTGQQGRVYLFLEAQDQRDLRTDHSG